MLNLQNANNFQLFTNNLLFKWESYFLILVMMTEIGIIVLIMGKWESRAARNSVGGYVDDEAVKRSEHILKWRRRLCFIIDAVTMLWTFLGATVGMVVVIIIARYGG